MDNSRPQDKIEAIVRELLEALVEGPVNLDVQFLDLPLDSVDQLQFVDQLGRRLDIEVRFVDLYSAPSVREFIGSLSLS